MLYKTWLSQSKVYTCGKMSNDLWGSLAPVKLSMFIEILIMVVRFYDILVGGMTTYVDLNIKYGRGSR